MRLGPIAGLSLLIVASGVASSVAADKRAGKRASGPLPAAAAEPAPELPANGPESGPEFRFGFSAQDPWSPESGSANIAGEFLFARPFTPADLFTSYFVPRPHVGGSLNLAGRTSFAYAGLTWSFDVTERIFVEGSLGGAVHNGSTNPFEGRVDRAALGCSPLFREAGAVGIKLSNNWSLMALVEHMSNGGACSDNRGLTNFGARFGYSF
jgi:lipid A 3-O-deacylase